MQQALGSNHSFTLAENARKNLPRLVFQFNYRSGSVNRVMWFCGFLKVETANLLLGMFHPLP